MVNLIFETPSITNSLNPLSNNGCMFVNDAVKYIIPGFNNLIQSIGTAIASTLGQRIFHRSRDSGLPFFGRNEPTLPVLVKTALDHILSLVATNATFRF